MGVVRGNTIRARWFGRDIVAGLKNLVGGEIKSYTVLLTEARNEAIDRMKAEAKKKGANCCCHGKVCNCRYYAGHSRDLAYGTAVVI